MLILFLRALIVSLALETLSHSAARDCSALGKGRWSRGLDLFIQTCEKCATRRVNCSHPRRLINTALFGARSLEVASRKFQIEMSSRSTKMLAQSHFPLNSNNLCLIPKNKQWSRDWRRDEWKVQVAVAEERKHSFQREFRGENRAIV